VGERYEPLPGITELPGWLWRRTGRRLRIVAIVVFLAALAPAVALVSSARESAQESAERERRQRAELRERRILELQAEQRPRFGRSESAAPPGADAPERLSARAAVLEDLIAGILADARRRVRLGALDGPILRVACEPFPRTTQGVGADRDLSLRVGRYACVAATGEFGRSEASVGGLLGHPYRAQVDFDSGRFALCKISGRPDPTPDPRVTTPRACGG
jgi:hypothetical protein